MWAIAGTSIASGGSNGVGARLFAGGVPTVCTVFGGAEPLGSGSGGAVSGDERGDRPNIFTVEGVCGGVNSVGVARVGAVFWTEGGDAHGFNVAGRSLVANGGA